MTAIIVSEVQGELVVDSRLIAKELNIQHESFMRTIDTHSISIEEFGHLRFEIGTVTNSVGATNKTKFCYLNKEQSTFVMTLSRNTPKVVECKKNLVKAFYQAEKLLKDKMIPYCHQLTERIEKLEKELAAKRETKSENNFFVLGDVDTFYLCFKRGDNAVKLFTHKTEDIDHICKALNAVTQNMQPVTRLTTLNCK